MKLTTFLFMLTFFGLTLVSKAQTPQSQMIIEQEVEVIISGNNSIKNPVSFFIKNGKVKSVSSQQGVNINIYYFDSSKIMHTVMSMAGKIQKQQMSNAISEMNNKYDNIDVEYSEDTKEIAGIVCKKATILLTSKKNTEKRTVWYDPNKTLSFTYNFGVVGLELIKGLPMQYENVQMGFKMIHTVKKINQSVNIKKGTFKLPSNR